MALAKNNENTSLLCSFGLISDIQYADVDDGTDYAKTENRYYRGSLTHLRKAIEQWKKSNVNFVVQLGDIIDGKCKDINHDSENCLKAVLDIFSTIGCQRYDILGNHEFYNFSLDYCLSNLNVGTNGWQSYSPHNRWRVIHLNSYDVSILGKKENDPKLKYAKELLKKKSPVFLEHGVNWFKNLPEEKHKYAPYNGAIGEEQMKWLSQELAASQAAGQLVLIMIHCPIEVQATHPKTVLWNGKEVLEILHSYQNVTAVFAGHDHTGGFFTDKHGLHHWTFTAPLTTDPNDKSFCVVGLHQDGIQVEAHSPRETSRFLPKRK